MVATPLFERDDAGNCHCKTGGAASREPRNLGFWAGPAISLGSAVAFDADYTLARPGSQARAHAPGAEPFTQLGASGTVSVSPGYGA